MFSATMTTDVDALITDFLSDPERISVALSGTPLENIMQFRYDVPNYYTKVNLIRFLDGRPRGILSGPHFCVQ